MQNEFFKGKLREGNPTEEKQLEQSHLHSKNEFNKIKGVHALRKSLLQKFLKLIAAVLLIK